MECSSESAYGQSGGSDYADEHIQQPVERSGGVEKCTDQHTEPDQQPDFCHDFAEAHGDRLYRPGEADAGSQAEVERGKKQRDDRVDFEPDDQTDG